MRQASRTGLTFQEHLRRHGMRDRYVGPDASLLAAGSWLYVLQPDPEHAGQRRAGELSRSGPGHLMHNAQPDRCHLSSIIVKMILVTYKFDVHPAPQRSRDLVTALHYRGEARFALRQAQAAG